MTETDYREYYGWTIPILVQKDNFAIYPPFQDRFKEDWLDPKFDHKGQEKEFIPSCLKRTKELNAGYSYAGIVTVVPVPDNPGRLWFLSDLNKFRTLMEFSERNSQGIYLNCLIAHEPHPEQLVGFIDGGFIDAIITEKLYRNGGLDITRLSKQLASEVSSIDVIEIINEIEKRIKEYHELMARAGSTEKVSANSHIRENSNGINEIAKRGHAQSILKNQLKKSKQSKMPAHNLAHENNKSSQGALDLMVQE